MSDIERRSPSGVAPVSARAGVAALEGPRLAKAVGVAAVLASGVSQEYGSGINFVMVNGLGSYPKVAWLVPAAIVTAGLLMIPKVGLFARLSQVAPRAGSSYVWLSRTTTLPVGFVVAFVWFVGIVAAMGFLAFATGTFLASTLEALHLPGQWAVTPGGHIIVGSLAIIVILALHYSGVRNYGSFIFLMFCIVLAATLLAAIYGFSTSQGTFLRELSRILGNAPAAPADQTPSLSAFISVIGLFIFLYGGLTGATSLGGEARDASRTMPRGIILSWFSALVLYAIVATALFHAVPWWTVQPLIKSHHSELATMPGLIGLVAPGAVGALINVLVFIIVVKTIAPQLQDSSRYLFAWAQDGLLPRAFLHTARSKAPDLALVVSALLGFLFLLEASLIGWSVGVSIRSATIVLVFGFLGAGAVNVWFNRQFAGAAWAQELRRHVDFIVFGILAVVVAIAALVAVFQPTPRLAWYFQPSFQSLVAAVLGALVYLYARSRAVRENVDLAARARAQLPAE